MRQLAEGYAEEIKEIVEKNSELKTSNTELVTFLPHLYSRSKGFFSQDLVVAYRQFSSRSRVYGSLVIPN